MSEAVSPSINMDAESGSGVAATTTPTPSPPAPVFWEARVRLDESIKNTNGQSNAISTTKYTLLTWLPKSLWFQFRRVANVYFLVISILMLIGTYATYVFQSPLSPYSTIVTFIFVLGVTCFKEGSEDLARYRSDKAENERKVTVVTFDPSSGTIDETIKETQHIKAGDIIKMVGRTQVPVDMLLMLTSLHADGNQCYIETANIDGETNLKLKEAPAACKSLIDEQGNPSRELFNGSLMFEPPNKSIYTFVGALKLNALGEGQDVAIGPENVLLRSSIFSNTDWGYGIAIYTGQETKVQMNNRVTTSKMSNIEQYANKAILIVFCAQCILVSISVISIYILGFNNFSKLPYVYPHNSGSDSVLPLWLEQWFVFFLLFNNFIPISLYVTIELVNVGQAALIAADAQIYDEDMDLATVVRSSNLVQELGQVSNVFSDKTGTLTRNEMRFVKFLVDGILYDVDPSYSSGGGAGTTGELSSGGSTGASHLPDSPGIYNFLRCLVTCHTVIREKDGTYRAESPDELALVEGVGKLGCFLNERGTVQMNIEMMKKQQVWEVLAVNAFNADRKRMSIVMREKDTNKYFVMCKGADNIMLPLCAMDAATKSKCEGSLLDLANMGLRTLCIAQKEMTQADATAWLQSYREAASSMSDRTEKLGRIAASLETNMQLLGITAIEDRLQDEVPEVIADLAKAGIVLWMLTGDKEETAINIGRSCNLLLVNTKTIFLTRLEVNNPSDSRENNEAASKKAYAKALKAKYDDILAKWQDGPDKASTGYKDGIDGAIKDLCLVMDGPSYKFFDEHNLDQRKQLLFIGQKVRSVIACRLTPKQKETLVGLVKKDTVPKATTLAIGDGANDVSMIREGDVGVGIFGKEGRQAANNADFAIGQFKFLRRLLLVHGRYNYIRQSRVFLYSLHKNMVITLTLYWFSYFAALSGTSLYETWVYSAYNLILGLPIIFFGILDRDLSQEFCMRNPQVYSTGKENTYLTTTAIAGWILNAIVFSIIFCLIFYYAVRPTFVNMSLYEAGTTVYCGLCMVLQCKIAYMHNQWAYPQILAMAISIGGMLGAFAFISWAFLDFQFTMNYLFMEPIFWFFGFFSVPLFVSLIDPLTYYCKLFFAPSNEMLYREIDRQEQFAKEQVLTFKRRASVASGQIELLATSATSALAKEPTADDP